MFNQDINFDKFLSISKIKSFVNLYYYIHTTLISNGTKLEKQIKLAIENKIQEENNNKFVISNLNYFFDNLNEIKDGKYIVFTKEIINSRFVIYNEKKKINTDCIIIEKNMNNLLIYISEIKSGSKLDTKKAKAERLKLELTIEQFKKYLSNIDNFNIQIKFILISFFEKNKEIVFNGLKKEFSIEEIMTGEEFCDFFNISYYDLLELKITKDKNKEEEKENTDMFFIKQILKELSIIDNEAIKNIIKQFCIDYLKNEK